MNRQEIMDTIACVVLAVFMFMGIIAIGLFVVWPLIELVIGDAR